MSDKLPEGATFGNPVAGASTNLPEGATFGTPETAAEASQPPVPPAQPSDEPTNMLDQLSRVAPNVYHSLAGEPEKVRPSGRGVLGAASELASGIASLPNQAYHAITDAPKTPEEAELYGKLHMNTNGKPDVSNAHILPHAALALKRLVVDGVVESYQKGRKLQDMAEKETDPARKKALLDAAGVYGGEGSPEDSFRSSLLKTMMHPGAGLGMIPMIGPIAAKMAETSQYGDLEKQEEIKQQLAAGHITPEQAEAQQQSSAADPTKGISSGIMMALLPKAAEQVKDEVTGAVGKGVNKYIRPTTAEVGGEDVRLPNQTPVGKFFQKAVPEKIQKFVEENTHPDVAKGISNVTGEAAGSTANVTPTDEDRLGIVGHADTLKAGAQETFQKLDQLSGNMLSDAQEGAEQAYGDHSIEGRKAYKYNMDLQDMIFDEYKDHPEFEGVDLDAAKAQWRKQMALREMSNSLVNAATKSSTTGATDYIFKKGEALSEGIDNLITNKRNTLERAGFDQDHIDKLKEFGRLVRKTGETKATGWLSGLAKAGSALLGYHLGGFGGAVEALTGETVAEKAGKLLTDKILGKAMVTPEALDTITSGLKKGESPEITLDKLKTAINNASPGWGARIGASIADMIKNGFGGEEGAAGAAISRRNVGEPASPSLIGKRGVKAPQEPVAPNYVYRARDVGEKGVSLQNTHAQATSDPAQAEKYAEEGQRGREPGEVVKIDLNKLDPKDYEVRQHPSGANWVKFKRPLIESEVEPHNPVVPASVLGQAAKTITGSADDALAASAAKKNEPGRTEGAAVLPTEQVGGTRISQRKPTAVNAPENALTDDLTLGTDAIKKADASKPGFMNKLAQVVAKYPGFQMSEEEALANPEAALRKFVDHVSDNLVWLHNQVPENVRNISKLWYDSAHELTKQWAQKYGVSHEQMAGAVAALSPQNEWNNNVEVANRVADILKNKQQAAWTPEMAQNAERIAQKNPGLVEDFNEVRGKKLADLPNPDQKAVWIRLYDEAHNGRQMPNYAPDGSIRGIARTPVGNQPATTKWSSMSAIAKAVSILEDGSKENIHTQLGDMHKIRNFYNNIIDPWSKSGDVTIDTHAVGAGHIRPMGGSTEEVLHNFGGGGAPSNSVHGVNGTYGVYAEAYRQAAAKLGILPRELQSITWEGIRSLFESRDKTPELKSKIAQIWKDHKNGEVTIERARQQILKAAGGFKNPKWLSDLGQNETKGTPAK